MRIKKIQLAFKFDRERYIERESTLKKNPLTQFLFLFRLNLRDTMASPGLNSSHWSFAVFIFCAFHCLSRTFLSLIVWWATMLMLKFNRARRSNKKKTATKANSLLSLPPLPLLLLLCTHKSNSLTQAVIYLTQIIQTEHQFRAEIERKKNKTAFIFIDTNAMAAFAFFSDINQPMCWAKSNKLATF